MAFAHATTDGQAIRTVAAANESGRIAPTPDQMVGSTWCVPYVPGHIYTVPLRAGKRVTADEEPGPQHLPGQTLITLPLGEVPGTVSVPNDELWAEPVVTRAGTGRLAPYHVAFKAYEAGMDETVAVPMTSGALLIRFVTTESVGMTHAVFFRGEAAGQNACRDDAAPIPTGGV